MPARHCPAGLGWLTNPRRTAYNRVYNRTSFSLRGLLRRLLPKPVMPERAELLFAKLQTESEIRALIGTSETADFDCKVPTGYDKRSWKESIAKAACGFTNAEGGVLVIGLLATRVSGDDSDVVRDVVLAEDPGAVLSSALDAILNLVEPGIEGIQDAIVPSHTVEGYGFVLLFIPKSEGSPRRSRADWRFYVRIASGTVPMEYFQIEDRFGRRPHPRLKLTLRRPPVRVSLPLHQYMERLVTLAVTNTGRGIARFPAVRVAGGIFLPNRQVGGPEASLWPLIELNDGWYSFRGGAD